MIKAFLILFVTILISLNVLSFAEILLFNRVRILAVTEFVSLATWIFLPDKESESNQKIGN